MLSRKKKGEGVLCSMENTKMGKTFLVRYKGKLPGLPNMKPVGGSCAS